MSDKYLIYGAIAGAVALIGVVVWYYRHAINNKLHDPKFLEFLHRMMLQAEEYFNSGEGQKKFNWVLDCAMTWLHLTPKQAEIAKEIVKTIIQQIFDDNAEKTTDEDGVTHTTVK